MHRLIPCPSIGYTALAVLTVSISSEKAGEAFDQSQWSGAGQDSIRASSQARTKRFEEMSVLERTGDFAKRWKFPIIGAS